MSSKYKLIVTDMDGTLLNDDKEISEGNLKAIRMVRGMGIRFAFLSGRQYKFLKEVKEKYDIDVDTIGLNGAEIRNEKGEIIWSRFIKKDVAKRIAKVLNKENAVSKIYVNNMVVANKPNSLDKIIDDIIISHGHEINDEMVESQYVRLYGKSKVVNDLSEFLDEVNCDIEKIEVINPDRNVLDKISEEIKMVADVFITSSYKLNIEIMHKDVNKGSAIKEFGDYLGIKTDEIMAFGDNLNDLEMIEAAGLGIAMENAVDLAKAKANYITLNNNDDGVAHAIKKFIG